MNGDKQLQHATIEPDEEAKTQREIPKIVKKVDKKKSHKKTNSEIRKIAPVSQSSEFSRRSYSNQKPPLVRPGGRASALETGANDDEVVISPEQAERLRIIFGQGCRSKPKDRGHCDAHTAGEHIHDVFDNSGISMDSEIQVNEEIQNL